MACGLPNSTLLCLPPIPAPLTPPYPINPPAGCKETRISPALSPPPSPYHQVPPNPVGSIVHADDRPRDSSLVVTTQAPRCSRTPRDHHDTALCTVVYIKSPVAWNSSPLGSGRGVTRFFCTLRCPRIVERRIHPRQCFALSRYFFFFTQKGC